MPSYSPMLEGKEAIRKSSKEMMNSGMKVKSVSFDTKSVEVNNKLITEIGTYKMTISMPQPDVSIEDEVPEYLGNAGGWLSED